MLWEFPARFEHYKYLSCSQFLLRVRFACFDSNSMVFIMSGLRHSRISVVPKTGAAIAIEDASATDTILSVKQRVFAANRKMHVRRQRLVYSAGPRGMDALADDETLGGAGVARDGSAELDVLVADLTVAEAAELGEKVCP